MSTALGSEVKERVHLLARRAAGAAPAAARLSRSEKDGWLATLAEMLAAEAAELIEANRDDVEAARAEGRPAAFVDRLTLTDQVIDSMIAGLRQVAGLDDPVGMMTEMTVRPNGLRVGRVRIPLGVIGFIYESRPNVTVDAAALCLKAGNAVILKGGSEAIRSNRALGDLIGRSLDRAGLPREAVQVMAEADRTAVTELLKLDKEIDLVIPRGGEGLIRLVTETARMPVLKHYKGVCHLYVDQGADHDMALALVVNGKVQRPGVCNALECLLVHRAEADRFLPRAAEELTRLGVELRGCLKTLALAPQAAAAGEEAWSTEYLDLILNIRVVDDMDQALDHIARHGSRHTEAICTADYSRANEFLRRADASVVLVNASTRFNDGGQLGLGAEIGISTDKLHAYGPMGLRELTTTKFVVYGEGQVRG